MEDFRGYAVGIGRHWRKCRCIFGNEGMASQDYAQEIPVWHSNNNFTSNSNDNLDIRFKMRLLRPILLSLLLRREFTFRIIGTSIEGAILTSAL